MNDLNILHLSDLHITSDGKKYSRLLANLINDIKHHSSAFPDQQVVIAVTGDIINRGEQKSVANAKEFFGDLKEALPQKVAAIYIVPGNHDKNRTDANKFLIPAYRSLMDNKVSYNEKSRNDDNILFNKSFVENLWRYQEDAYEQSGYYELIDYIYDELYPEMQDIKKIVRKTYGVHVLEIKGKKYCFVLLNTAWSCIDDKDIRHIILGDFQIEEIYDTFRNLTDDTEELTFVMGHHPLECLYGNEQDRLFDKMISFSGMLANAYICGHTHDRTVVNWSNNRHTIYTLVTGIGWPESGGGHVGGNHFYSVYRFNLELNSMDILVKNSYDNGDFKIDPRIYTGQDVPSVQILTRPIRFQEERGAIVFHTGEGVSPKVLYDEKHFFEYSSEFARKLIEISMESKSWLEEDIEDFYNNYEIPPDLTEEDLDELDRLLYNHVSRSRFLSFDEYECNSAVENIMKKNLLFVYDKFQGYLQKLCDKLEQKLVGEIASDKVVRVHCRYWDHIAGLYRELCTSFSHREERETYGLSDIGYGDLIEAVMRNGRNQSGCLIYTINEKLCKNKLKDHWRDFITIIPQIENNVRKRKNNRGKDQSIPCLTFGVTINSVEHEILLYCMDHFSIHEVLGNILQTYIDIFLIDVNRFCTWVTMDTAKGEEKSVGC